MKYTKEATDQLVALYNSGQGLTVAQLAERLQVPERSIIAKLSSLGCYQKKIYTNKRGEVPIKKSQHIEHLAQLLDVECERLESLEKVNKAVLQLIIKKLDPQPHQTGA